MKYDPRVLVVEDTKYWQDIFADILSSHDYRVTAARSYEEAKGILDRQSFDVVIVDIRLSEGDELNKDGMRVLEVIRSAGDPTNIIVVSGFGDRELYRQAFKKYSVLDFINKDTFDVKEFIRLVDEGTQGARAYGIGTRSLTKTFLIEAGLTDIEVSSLPGSEYDVEELLQDMFERIWPIASTPQSRSALIVTQDGEKIAQIIGWSKAMGEGVVVRLGAMNVIKEESQNFNKYVKGLMKNVTIKMEPFYKAKLGGIIYVLQGAESDTMSDFTSYFSKEMVSDIIDVMDRLFKYSAGKLYTDQSVNKVKVDLSSAYRSLLNKLIVYQKQELKKEESYLVELEDLDRLSYLRERDQKIQQDVNPIEFVQGHSFVYESPVGMVHGDFCNGNIIVDSQKRTWLLGFYNTGKSDVMLKKNDTADSPALRAYQAGKRNLLHDFATMEVSIRKTLTVVNPEAVAAFDLVLCKPKEFGESISSQATSTIPELNKAFKVIGRIRDLASEMVDFKGDMQLYYAELLFQFLGVYLQMEDSEKRRIWPTIAKLAERLRDWR